MSSLPLEDWHRDSLPMFLERVHVRLAGGCAAGHLEWTAAARYRAFHNDENTRQRAAWFAHDLQTAPQQVGTAGDGAEPLVRLSLVDLVTGEVIDRTAPTSGGDPG